ncbi:dynein assembly factor 3, axonemal-like isoform X2 [Limulus polyphemus]|uniref:Dynein assembly factor 3, axonemal-like isoform X2 n=1 Tax=Limulus polyphemus TaxID=6850 RepID=A0ABM1SKA9_LIMPO|nr:dynein assembly factor 3, axonemal-like isoform X2 [Limulus polyphemus]
MNTGFGKIVWWGFSPALNFLNESYISDRSERMKMSDEKMESLHILVVGAADSRHLLKTIAKSYEHTNLPFEMYVVENSIESYARQLMLLGIAFEQAKSLQEKTELLLEVFGNTLIRQSTLNYIQNKSSELIRMVTDFEELKQKMPFINLEALKYKERDSLESVFKFWRNPDSTLFDISKYWDLRLRHLLGPRFDSRDGVFDWDYNMKILNKGASIISSSEYKYWRKTGIAFHLREGDYNGPNKTLTSEHENQQYIRRGYWGDVVSSPYLAFGIECEDKEYLKKSNNIHCKTAQDVSARNVTAMMYELKYSRPYKNCTENIFGEREENHKGDLNMFQISFLPVNFISDLNKKACYQKLFDIVYFSNSMVHHFVPEFSTLLKRNAVVLVETAKFILDLTSEQEAEYIKKVTNMAEAAGCEVVGCQEPNEDSFMKFIFRGNKTQDNSES